MVLMRLLIFLKYCYISYYIKLQVYILCPRHIFLNFFAKLKFFCRTVHKRTLQTCHLPQNTLKYYGL